MRHPHLSTLHSLYLTETQPFRKVHRMIDLFESLIKMHTVVILAEYVRHNRLSDAAKGLLSQGLRTPSLGTWQLFSRVLFDELDKEGFTWMTISFPAGFRALEKALNEEKTNVIAFRNGYAHGATPSDSTCEDDMRKYEPFLSKLMEAQWLQDTACEVRKDRVFLATPGGGLSLHPFLLHRPETDGPSLAFFNDLKNDRVGLLNYPLGKHYRERAFYAEFLEHLPLHEWRRSGNNEFHQRIEELTETFKGRSRERALLLSFVRQHRKGYLSVQGNPGIGKSALLAQFFKDLRAEASLGQVQVVEYFIRRGTQQAQAEYMLGYLLRRTDEFFPKGREVRAEGQAAFDLQSQLFGKWRLWGEQGAGQKLLILIDGLDEGIENRVVDYLPRENFDNILFVYGSRPGGHRSIDELWTHLPIEHHTRVELAGLSREDIRALVYEVANKYEVERESPWIDAVQARSQGNPLYLKLLCDSLEQGGIRLNDVRSLPEKIDEYYKAILGRYANDPDGDALLAGLYTFAAAKDYLTMAHLRLINKLGDATIHRIGGILKEVLYENPLTEEVLDYQLFHESFREYLVREKRHEVEDAANWIIDFCAGWRQQTGKWEQRYALEHYAAHLADGGRVEHAETLLQLLYDTDYQLVQKSVLKGFAASRRMFCMALVKATAIGRDADMLEAALCLVDLWYEEANDAAGIIAMVAGGDIELALHRIESFGGNDEKGLRRKCTLYLLCLMELTLLSGQEKPFRRAAIEILLNHFDEQMPTDHSVLKWNDFFPSYMVFPMACEWADMGLDYLIVYRRTDSWDSGWLAEKGPYSDMHLEVIMTCIRAIIDDGCKSRALSAISIELAKQGKLEEAHECIQEISDEYRWTDAMGFICSHLTRQGKFDDALAYARAILDSCLWSSAIPFLSTELGKNGKFEKAASVMQEFLVFARGTNDFIKSISLSSISTELIIQGKIDEGTALMHEAITSTHAINDDYYLSEALASISSELAKQGKMEEALFYAQSISEEWVKWQALSCISTELSIHGKVEEALACLRGITDESYKCKALASISTELAKRGKVEEAASAMQEAIAFAHSVSEDKEWLTSSALSGISIELAKQGKMEQAFICARGIIDLHDKYKSLRDISTELAKQEKEKEALTVIEKALSYSRGDCEHFPRSRTLQAISSELSIQGKVDEALSCAHGIGDNSKKYRAFQDISIELVKQGKVEEALSCARGIIESYKSSALKDISTELAKQGRAEAALAFAHSISEDEEWVKWEALSDISIELAKQGKMEQALTCARGISDLQKKCIALCGISTELSKQGSDRESSSVIGEAISFAQSISDDVWKSLMYASISTEVAKKGNYQESASIMQLALLCVRDIADSNLKNRAFEGISIELAKQGRMEEAISCARSISDQSDISFALREITIELVKQGKTEDIINCVRGISEENDRYQAFRYISIELAKQGKVEEALACARGITDESYKSGVLSGISSELAKQGSWHLSEQTGLEIPFLATRHACWQSNAKTNVESEGWKTALEAQKKLQSEEAKIFYLKGWVDSLVAMDADAVCLRSALPILTNDTQSVEVLLQKYSLNLMFFGDPCKEQLSRFDRTLNIQWAMDIAATFPSNTGIQRLSTNVEDWIHEVNDEDDRDQVRIWVRQVAKGRMTEEEFRDKIKLAVQ